MITPQSYAHSLSKSEKLVSDNVKAYLKEPSEDNVHDLRTSIRRLLTTANILPKKIRCEKDSRRYLESHEKLLSLNAKVRDIDIILSKLPHHGDDPAYAKLAKQLQKMRESSLKKTQRFAESINDKTNLPIETRKLSERIIQKRFKETAKAFTETLKERLHVVVKEPRNINELHKLREDSRRLRFTLEIDDTPESSRLLPVLETWQDILGKIRDSDIFISHFEDEKQPAKIGKVLEQEKSARKENYQKFLKIFKESPSPLS
ncbi:MAG TPA: CHAD domain-containing protein [Candidatus Angelobacter sp.]|nr:CHAD domain-containing protein [Candidatus Angelobacter sp.]